MIAIVTIVALGIGSFSVGSEFLSLFLNSPSFRVVNYIGVDASFEMLAQALDLESAKAASLVQAIQLGGAVFGLDSDFASLVKHRHYLPEDGRRIFVIFGNTLGNEPQAEPMLRWITNEMNEGDYLFI